MASTLPTKYLPRAFQGGLIISVSVDYQEVTLKKKLFNLLMVY